MFGHRPDGKRLRDIDPIIQITPYLMPMRCDAQVFLQHNLDYEMLARYIAKKASEGEKITFMQIIAAAYVRAVSQHPEINRFIFNKQYYARNNCSISYAVLMNPQDNNSSETTVRVLFDLTDTIFDGSRADHDHRRPRPLAGPLWDLPLGADRGAALLQRNVHYEQRQHRSGPCLASYLQFR